MPTIEITIPRPHPGQRDVILGANRYTVISCGRRWGKTTLGVNRLIDCAIRGHPVAWLGPEYKMLSEAWRDITEAVAPLTVRRQESEHRLELRGGGTIEGWSLDNANAIRGRAYKRIVVDEAAQVPTLERDWGYVIRPTLTDYAGDAWFLSTPKGLNYFFTLWQRGQDPIYDEWISFKRPSSENPHIPADEIIKQERETPETVFQQEYLAEFLDERGGVFRRVREAVTAQKQDHGVWPGQYIFGVDWGKHQDFTAIAVINQRTSELVYLDRFKDIDYIVQRQRLMALYERFCGPDKTAPMVQTIIAERNTGEAIIEQLQRDNLPVRAFLTTNESKRQAIESLALAFERGVLRIIDDPILLGELMAFQATRLPSGLLRYAAPEGMHDDCVIALALAWSAAVPAEMQNAEVIVGMQNREMPW